MMREVIRIPKEKTAPSIDAVLKGQGFPEGANPDQRTVRLVEEALSVYRESSDPVGILAEISKEEFISVYHGEGKGEKETPLGDIYTSAESLCLFAVTVGQAVSSRISSLFDQGEFAPGSMLDTVASEGTEVAAEGVELHYRDYLREKEQYSPSSGTMRFSPGYCGWDLSSQKKLFEYLRPGEIGITLRESFLMEPLKSISGVIVTGPREIFKFDDDFPFCKDCETHSCRERIKAVLAQ
jgi:cobalamin-dependent methionine synthase I